MKRMKAFMKSWAAPVLIAVSVFCLFRFVLMVGYVPSGSMEPTLKTGSLILALRIHPEPKVGDIAVFEYGDTLMVKRIAAVGGDRIEHNGEVISVSPGCYYMLGDNSSDSFDSRYWDDPFIPRDDVIAIVLFAEKKE